MPDPIPAAPAAPVPEPTSKVNADGTFVDGWYKDYDEVHHPTLSRFKKFDDFVNSHGEQRKKIGELGDKLGADPERVLIIPDDDADDTTKAEYRRKLGVSDNLSDYVFERSPELSERIIVNDEELAEYAKLAQELDMTPAKFNKLVNSHLAILDKKLASFDEAQSRQAEQAIEDGHNMITKIFGAEKIDRVKQANSILEAYASMEVKNEKGENLGTIGEKLDAEFPKLKDSPWMVLLLDGIAKDFSEDRIGKLTSTAVSSPADLEKKMDELRSRPAYYDKSHPDYAKTMQERDALMKQKSRNVA